MDSVDDQDILKDWKNQRFVITDLLAMDGLPYVVVLVDMDYWPNKADELISWCLENGFVQQGMTVELPNEEALTLFCLRWS